MMLSTRFASFVAVTALALAACGSGDSGTDFIGAYQTTLTVSGSGSQTFTDNVTISEGTTTDLVVQSQMIGTMKASIIGDTSFAIDQQQISLTVDGQAVTVTAQGQGNVNDGVLTASGTVSGNGGSLSFTMNGRRL